MTLEQKLEELQKQIQDVKNQIEKGETHTKLEIFSVYPSSYICDRWFDHLDFTKPILANSEEEAKSKYRNLGEEDNDEFPRKYKIAKHREYTFEDLKRKMFISDFVKYCKQEGLSLDS